MPLMCGHARGRSESTAGIAWYGREYPERCSAIAVLEHCSITATKQQGRTTYQSQGIAFSESGSKKWPPPNRFAICFGNGIGFQCRTNMH